jgi:alpha-tubulin suppressor-like RCC1 family protein
MKTKPKLINWIQPVLLTVAMVQAVSSGAQPIVKIAAGLFLRSDGSLWAMGADSISNTNRPEQLLPGGVVAIADGLHCLVVKNDGSLWAAGDGQYGQLGDGTYNSTSQLEEIVGSGVTKVALSDYTSLFIKSDGSLWAMGYNALGGLGDGTFGTNDYAHFSVNVPEQIVAGGVTGIGAGQFFSIFLKDDGSLWGMGDNGYGQLGDGTYITNSPYGIDVPEEIISNGVTAISAGAGHSMFIKSDGSLWTMGYNSEGALGDGTFNSTNRPQQVVSNGVVAIVGGGSHSLFLKSDGSLWAMGWNQYGQLGDGTYNHTNRPEQIVAGGVIAIAAGDATSFFLKNDGSLWGMGQNLDGELGDGTYSNRNVPIQIVAGPPGYNQISVQLLSGGSVGLSLVGIAGAQYALDRTHNLSPASWVPQATNSAGSGGLLVFTNAPDQTTNNFWRIRSVP